jgi:hypothetical protein
MEASGAAESAVLYTPQELTAEQQAQARKNIGAIEPPETAEAGQTIVVKEVDESGKPVLWEAADFPSSGSKVLSYSLTLEEDCSAVSLPMPATWENILQFNVHASFPRLLGGEPKMMVHAGNSYDGLSVVNSNSGGFNFNGSLLCMSEEVVLFATGSSSTQYHEGSYPKSADRYLMPLRTSDILEFYFYNSGEVVFPKGTQFDVWGLWK